MDPATKSLNDVLERSRACGFLGRADIEAHIRHAESFLGALRDRARILDLGSGGGLPGLVLASSMTESHFVLLDSQARRCSFLRESINDLGLSDRVSVVEGRAEDLARQEKLRASFDAVVARSFGGPAVVAECAAGFLRGAGSVVAVSEPPVQDPQRWPDDGLAVLNLAKGPTLSLPHGTIQVLESLGMVDDRYPRRVGIPAKRPLF